MPGPSKLHPCTILLTLTCLFGATSAHAQSIAKVGIEFQVNSYTSGRQARFAVDLDSDGDFVVVYDSFDQDGDGYGIFARRFDAAGVPQASELQVNSFTLGNQRDPDVALSNDGSFIVVWSGFILDGSGASIFGRRFDSSGQAQAAEFEVNSYTSGGEFRPRLAIDTDGAFVVVWVDFDRDGAESGIFARRFNAAGTPQNVDFQVNSFADYAQSSPEVAKHGAGDFIVAWQSFGQDGANFGVFGRAFDAAGNPQASEFQVNAYTGYGQRYPSVAADTTGSGFVVAWQSEQYFPSYPDIFARRFSAAGSATGPEIRVNPRKAFKGAANVQGSPTVAGEPDGDFVVAWASLGAQDGDGSGVFARRFNAAGTAQTNEMQVNSYTVGFQGIPVVDIDGEAGFVIVWTSDHDGSVTGGFGQRFATLAVLDVDGNGSVEALSDGLLSLRYQFGFRGAVLVNGAVDLAGCRRCDAPAIESYLQAQL